MKIFTFFVFSGLMLAQNAVNDPKVKNSTSKISGAYTCDKDGCRDTTNDSHLQFATTPQTASITKTELMAIDSLTQRYAALDRDKNELQAEICAKVSATPGENCEINLDKKTVTLKPKLDPVKPTTK